MLAEIFDEQISRINSVSIGIVVVFEDDAATVAVVANDVVGFAHVVIGDVAGAVVVVAADATTESAPAIVADVEWCSSASQTPDLSTRSSVDCD